MNDKQREQIEMGATFVLTREIVALVTAKEVLKRAIVRTYGLPGGEAEAFVNDFVAEAERKLAPKIRGDVETINKESKHPLEDLFQHYLEGGK